MRRFLHLFKALRPKQWTKNLLLFAALLFSRNLFRPDLLGLAALGFVMMCVLSSCGYLYNDLKDIEADRLHPTKRNRPLASGELPSSWAWAFIILAGIPTLVASWLLRPAFGMVVTAYLITTLSYTAVLKHLVILDVMGIASGFIFRAVAGAVVIDVPISPWFLVCIAFGSLFLAMCKRYAELQLLDANAGAHRKNLEDYSRELLLQMLGVASSGTAMSYALYTLDPSHSAWLMMTLPFMLYGLFRYQYLVIKRGEGGEPEKVFLKDRPLQIDIVLYLLVVVATLHLAD